MRQPRQQRAQRGVTLIELMVAMVILGFAIAAAFAMSYTLLAGFTDTERVLKAQRAARGGIDLIGDAIRSSSPGVTTGALTDLTPDATNTCPPQQQAIVVDNDEGTNGSDAITIIHATGGVIGFLQAPLVLADTQVTVSAENTDFFERVYFEDGDMLVLANGTEGHLVQITTVQSEPTVGSPNDPWVLNLDPGWDSKCTNFAAGQPPFDGTGYPAGTLVLRARLSRFAVCEVAGTPYLILGDADADCDSAEADFEPVAEGVEDLQIAIGIDKDASGRIDEVRLAADDDEWIHNVAAETVDPVNDILTATPRWKQLRLSVVARTVQESSRATASTRPAIEDHTAGTADVFRRRVLSTVLELRNIDN